MIDEIVSILQFSGIEAVLVQTIFRDALARVSKYHLFLLPSGPPQTSG